MAVQRIVSHQLESVIECECNEDGCKSCALKVNIQLPEVEVEDCEGVASTVQALPVAIQGVPMVRLCVMPPIVDIEYICDGYTNTWQKITTITPVNDDGTLGTPIETQVDTGISCDEPKPDYEPVKICRNGTIHLVSYRYDEDDSQTEISAIDTGIACNVTRDVDVLINCNGTKKVVTVEGSNPTQVVLDPEQVVKVTLDPNCQSPDVDISFVAGCSSIDGRFLVQRVSTDKLTDTDTITLLESDLATVVTDGSTMVNCSGADYELASTACMENTTTGDKYQVLTFVNPTDKTDFYKIYVDVNGDVVNEQTGLTPCSNECESNMEFERCFDTGAGSVSVQGYYTLSAGNIETYTVAKIIASTDPAYSVGDDVLTDVPTWDQISCEAPAEDETDTPLTIVTGTGNIPAGFKSVTINNITGITTVAGGYQLGNGRRDNSISFGTERGNNINELLPAITATGGTFQWIGLN